MITVVLADDHAIVREGLRLLLENEHDIIVVGEASDGREAVQMVRDQCPRVLIMDIAMPGLNGLEATEQIRLRFPATHVVILTMYSNEEYVRRALQMGAQAYVLKEGAGAEVIEAIRAVCADQQYLSPRVAGYTSHVPASHAGTQALQALSEREREVLQLLVEGHTSARIGTILGLSPKTVDTYRSRLMHKLGLSDMASLVKFAIQHGVISLD